MKANINTYHYKSALTLVTIKSLPLSEHNGLPLQVKFKHGFGTRGSPQEVLCYTYSMSNESGYQVVLCKQYVSPTTQMLVSSHRLLYP